MITKVDLDDFVEKPDFNEKLKNLNKKVTSNKTSHLQTEKKLTDLANKVVQVSQKRYSFLLGRIHFTGDDGYQKFLANNSLILDSSKKVTNWILKVVSSEKIEPFATNLEPIMSNLANGGVILKFKQLCCGAKKFFFIA